MRALWTAASGMKAQQLNIDTISNNLSNVNTTGFKKQKLEFKDLLYESIKKSNLVEGQGQPVNLEIGHGVMPFATSRVFMSGNLDRTENPTDLALDGRGFFAIQGDNDDEILYTRDGNLKFSVDGDTRTLVTSDGHKVLSTDDDVIEIANDEKDFSVSQEGRITVKNAAGETVEKGQIKIVDFLNPEGLEAIGGNFFKQTNASGEAIPDEERNTKIQQGFLESSNVQIVDEMVRMIMAQRAYEINSKAIQTSDDMMQTANNLKR